MSKKEVSLQTFARRVRERQWQEVNAVLAAHGILVYGLPLVKSSPSPHLEVRKFLDQIISAVKLEVQA